jgi:hypothetical protein
VALCGSDDRSVSERLLAQWGDMTSGSFQHHVFDRSGHYFWLDSCHQGGAEEERCATSRSAGGGSVGGDSSQSERRSHEKEFLSILIRAANPFHILLSEGMDEEQQQGSGDEEDDQRSAVSSVTFQDSYRADSDYPSSPGGGSTGRRGSPISRESSARGYR